MWVLVLPPPVLVIGYSQTKGLCWSLIVVIRQRVLYWRFRVNQGAAEQSLPGVFGRDIKSFWAQQLILGTEQHSLTCVKEFMRGK